MKREKRQIGSGETEKRERGYSKKEEGKVGKGRGR